jgi:hypothetical protein
MIVPEVFLNGQAEGDGAVARINEGNDAGMDKVAPLVTKMEESGIRGLYAHEVRLVMSYIRRHPDDQLTARWVAALQKSKGLRVSGETPGAE